MASMGAEVKATTQQLIKFQDQLEQHTQDKAQLEEENRRLLRELREQGGRYEALR